MDKEIFLSIDPGATGGIAIFKNLILDSVYDFGYQRYKDIFTQYKGCNCYMEYIANVMGGAYASFKLSRNIGEIIGLGYGLVNIIEKGNTSMQWKKPWSEDLIKPRGVKWKPDEAKRRDCLKCAELFPNADIYVRDENGNIKYTKHKDGTTEPKFYDGRCDAILIGQSRIERGLLQ